MATAITTSTEVDPKVTRVDPFDLTRADLWAEDRWQEPMRELRAKGPIHWNDSSKFGQTRGQCHTRDNPLANPVVAHVPDCDRGYRTLWPANQEARQNCPLVHFRKPGRERLR